MIFKPLNYENSLFEEFCTLLGYYAASTGNPLLTFQDNILVVSSRVKRSKRPLDP
jgi:hypothetical protein